jgi:hypothetical protein
MFDLIREKPENSTIKPLSQELRLRASGSPICRPIESRPRKANDVHGSGRREAFAAQ